MRDVRVRDQLSPGLRVKIVRPEDEEKGLTVEGVIAEILTKDEFDPAGIEVRLVTGEKGRVLRVWAPVPPRPQEKLPTYESPRESHAKWKLLPKESDVERAARELLGQADMDFMMDQKEHGHSGDALKEHGIRSEDLEARAKDLLADVDDDELERRMRERGFEDRDD